MPLSALKIFAFFVSRREREEMEQAARLFQTQMDRRFRDGDQQ